MNLLADDLNRHLEEAASKYGFRYADVDQYFEGHRLCDNFAKDGLSSGWYRTWFKNGVDQAGKNYTQTPFAHPTLEGQNAYRRALVEVLKC
jgi:xylose isomerase